jgi:RNA ligase (TIGR02306 family)
MYELGWQVIVKKGDFKIDDLCIFAEIDSIFPEKPEFEFLRLKHFRIKTMKMKGVLSQGIIFSLHILGPDVYTGMLRDHYSGKTNLIGLDISDLIGVIKFELPISPGQKGNTKGNFPLDIIPKTDEMRLQSVPKLLDEMRGMNIYITEKLDGTSFTGIYLNGELRVCSRNLELREGDPVSIHVPEDVYWRVAHNFNLIEKLKRYGGNIAIQGEICGEGIAGNPLGLKGQHLFVFNIYDIDTHKYLDFQYFVMVASNLGLRTVPILEVKENFNMTLEELLKYAEGKYNNTKNNREGIVLRPIKETHSKVLGGRMSCKLINNDYLLKEEK